MEFIEERCPDCGGILHIPVELKEIICMYCGYSFTTGESEHTTTKADRSEIETKEKRVQQLWSAGDLTCITLAEEILEQENFNYVANSILGKYHFPQVLLEQKSLMDSFKINLYEEAFTKYMDSSKVCLDYMERACAAVPDRRGETLSDFVAFLISEVEKSTERIGGKKKQEDYLQDLKMVLALYMIPMILEMKLDFSEVLADNIIKQWCERFPLHKFKKGYYSEIQGGFRKKGFCYITTAVCESLGKSDDCYELHIFRWYRDHYLREQKNGEELILEYYRLAPYVVFAINKLKESADIYKELWNTYLSGCLSLIEEERYSECMEKYKTMVYELEEKYSS